MNVIISEMETLKTTLKAIWTAGDFGKIACLFADDAAEFVNRLNLRRGMRVLDVACGTGNQSLPAARAGAVVTGIDIAPNLIEQARSRAAEENLPIRFDEGDAENLPYQSADFDAVISMFGAMFAPRPDKVSAELIRVCRPGGLIAMANWTPEGFVGQMFKVINAHVPPPKNMSSPLLWGNERQIELCFGPAISELQLTRRLITFEFPFGVGETIEHWSQFYGPVHKAFCVLDTGGKSALRRDLENLWAENNLSGNGVTRVDAEYLEVVAIRSQ
jgi:SAM-dependent methyltransferase